MVVELSPLLAPAPGGAPHLAEPVVRRERSVSLPACRVRPDIIVSVGLLPSLRPHEPLVPVAAVVGHEVHNEFEVELVDSSHQPEEVFLVSEQRIDGPVVGNVVAKVFHGTLVYRSKPDCLHLEGDEVLQLLSYSSQVAVTVVISVVQGQRVDLTDFTSNHTAKTESLPDIWKCSSTSPV